MVQRCGGVWWRVKVSEEGPAGARRGNCGMGSVEEGED